jgi:hypothetical protein
MSRLVILSAIVISFSPFDNGVIGSPLVYILYHIFVVLSRGFQKFLQKFLKGFATYRQPIAVDCDFGYPCGVATLQPPCPFDTYIIPHFVAFVKGFLKNFLKIFRGAITSTLIALPLTVYIIS